MKTLRHYNNLLLATCCLLLAPAMVLAGQDKWNPVPGGKVVSGQYQLKCGAGSGWQKCGEEEMDEGCFLDGTTKNRTMFVFGNSGTGQNYSKIYWIYWKGKLVDSGFPLWKRTTKNGYKYTRRNGQQVHVSSKFKSIKDYPNFPEWVSKYKRQTGYDHICREKI